MKSHLVHYSKFIQVTFSSGCPPFLLCIQTHVKLLETCLLFFKIISDDDFMHLNKHFVLNYLQWNTFSKWACVASCYFDWACRRQRWALSKKTVKEYKISTLPRNKIPIWNYILIDGWVECGWRHWCDAHAGAGSHLSWSQFCVFVLCPPHCNAWHWGVSVSTLGGNDLVHRWSRTHRMRETRIKKSHTSSEQDILRFSLLKGRLTDHNEETEMESNIQVWWVGRGQDGDPTDVLVPKSTPHLVQPQRWLAKGGSPSPCGHSEGLCMTGVTSTPCPLSPYCSLPMWLGVRGTDICGKQMGQ